MHTHTQAVVQRHNYSPVSKKVLWRYSDKKIIHVLTFFYKPLNYCAAWLSVSLLPTLSQYLSTFYLSLSLFFFNRRVSPGFPRIEVTITLILNHVTLKKSQLPGVSETARGELGEQPSRQRLWIPRVMALPYGKHTLRKRYSHTNTYGYSIYINTTCT